MKLTINIKKTETVEIEVPKYFTYERDFYRLDEDQSFTKVMTMQFSSLRSIRNRIEGEYINFEQIKEITEREFKLEFCKAVAEIAGFEFDPTEWQDQESDVHKEVAA